MIPGVCLEELPLEQEDEDDGEKDIQDRERNEGRRQTTHGSNGILGTHHTPDDPRLATYFRHDPPRLDGDKSERPGSDEGQQ